MTTQGSVILAAIIIGGSILGASFIDPYQLAMDGGGPDGSYAWRINKRTGQVVACQVTYDPFKLGGDVENAPAKPQAKPMVIIECGDD